MEDEGVNIIEERRKQLEDKLKETDNRIKSLRDRVKQLETDMVNALKERDKIQDDLRCPAVLKIEQGSNDVMVLRCKYNIGHEKNHYFSEGNYSFDKQYTVIEHPSEKHKNMAKKDERDE